MPIPAQVFYNLLGLLGFVSVLAFIFSWSDGTTAEKILALIKE